MQNNSNENYLFDLIQNIQSKMNSENTIDKIEENPKNNNSNFDFSNLFNMLNNQTSNQYKNEESNANSFDIGNILSMFNNSSNNSNYSNTENDFDLNKIQSILSTISKKDPRKELLLALKPFLRKSRQDKINEYLMYLTIGNALGIFNSKGDSNE